MKYEGTGMVAGSNIQPFNIGLDKPRPLLDGICNEGSAHLYALRQWRQTDCRAELCDLIGAKAVIR